MQGTKFGLNCHPRVQNESSTICQVKSRPGRLRVKTLTNIRQTKQMQTSPSRLADHSQGGQSLVEFALVLLFIILPITFVLIDGAIMLFTYAEVTNAAREASRSAAIYQCGAPTTPAIDCTLNPTQTFAQQIAAIDAGRLAYVDQYFQVEDRRWLSALIGYPQCTRAITYTPDTPVMGDPYRQLDSLTLTISCPRRLFFGLVGAGSIQLVSRSTMRIEPGGIWPAASNP